MMVQSFLEYRVPISNTVDLTPDMASFKITNGEWDMAEQMVPILEACISLLDYGFLCLYSSLRDLWRRRSGSLNPRFL